jgi:hypothetical protein
MNALHQQCKMQLQVARGGLAADFAAAPERLLDLELPRCNAQ